MPFIQVYDVSNNMQLKSATKNKISKLAQPSSIFVSKDSIVITIQGSIGRIALTQYDAYIDRTLLVFTEYKLPIIKKFFIYLLFLLFKIEKRKAPGGTIKTITKEALSSFIINLPCFDEQQKIADCLSSFDELITTEAKKLDALKAHKKGLMQQLFPAEGETVSKLRFPEFRDAEEWEVKQLEELIHFENGKGHEQYISLNGKYIVVNSKFISTNGRVKKYTDNQISPLEKGDIVMVMSDVPKGKALAKCFYINKNDLYSLNQRICALKPKYVESRLLCYMLNRNKYYLSFDSGVGQTNLTKREVLNCPIFIPPLIEEQKKIADCLSSFDELITTEAKKIDALKAHKKGLMQQLFPSSDEVKND